MGCIPAFDKFVKDAMKDIKTNHIENPSLSLARTKRCSTIRALWKFWFDNRDEFDSISRELKDKGHPDYPPMKLLDMYLWKRGQSLPVNRTR